MSVSIRDWADRWMRKTGRIKRKPTGFLATCASLGLATAWAAPAAATTVRLEVTPTLSLREAWVGYYHLNDSSVNQRFLGDVPAGQTSVYLHDFPQVPPEAFSSSRGYLLVGLYGEPGSESVMLSYINDSPITNGETWDSFILPISDDEKQKVIDGLSGTWPFSVGAFFNGVSGELGQDFGNQVTLVHYSLAGFGGTAIATVPEPATWVLVVGAAGILPLVRRNRR